MKKRRKERINKEITSNATLMRRTVENISETFFKSSLCIDISRVADNSKPKLTNILKYIIMDKEKFTKPKISTPKTLTKYGKVIKGKSILIPCNADKEKKLDNNLFLSSEVLNTYLSLSRFKSFNW